MMNGDLSNQFAPAIAIDVDDLIVKTEKKLFGRKKYELVSKAEILLHNAFSREITIYLICIRSNPKEAEAVQKFIDDRYLPYSRFYKLTKTAELQGVLEQQHLTAYYHKDMEHFPPVRVSNKAVAIRSIQEVL